MVAATLQLAGRAHDSIVDGPGLRYVIFTQGCPLACAGCHNPTTQLFGVGASYVVDELVADMRSNPLITGLTLSGGEPTLQPGGCAELAEAAHDTGLDVWCYSGYTIERLLRRRRTEPALDRLLHAVDVLVDGPFVLAKRSLTTPWRGSTNQRLIDVPATLDAGRATLWQAP